MTLPDRVAARLAGARRPRPDAEPAGVLFPADIVHVAAMASGSEAWRCSLAAVPVRRRALGAAASAGASSARTASRFSGVALARWSRSRSSGTLQAVVEVGSVSALLDTGYGRIVLAKALLARRAVGLGVGKPDAADPGARPGVGGGGEPRSGIWRSLRRNVRIEVGLIAVVARDHGRARLLSRRRADTSSAAAAPPQGRVSGRTDDRRRDAPVHGRPGPGRAEPAQPLPASRRARPYPRAHGNVRAWRSPPRRAARLRPGSRSSEPGRATTSTPRRASTPRGSGASRCAHRYVVGLAGATWRRSGSRSADATRCGDPPASSHPQRNRVEFGATVASLRCLASDVPSPRTQDFLWRTVKVA